MLSKRLFMVVNEDRFSLSHRKDIAVAAIAAGESMTITLTGKHEVFNSEL